jgi:integrase
MVFSFARIGAVVGMRVEDYYPNGKRWWLRLHEKGGKFHEVPVHHNAEAYLDVYTEVAGIAGDKKGLLFRSVLRKSGKLTTRPLRRDIALAMVKRRAVAAGLSERICCHTFRTTGITAYLENGGTIEKAQQIAAHVSPKTTKLYDRTGDWITLDEIGWSVISRLGVVASPGPDILQGPTSPSRCGQDRRSSPESRRNPTDPALCETSRPWPPHPASTTSS